MERARWAESDRDGEIDRQIERYRHLGGWQMERKTDSWGGDRQMERDTGS